MEKSVDDASNYGMFVKVSNTEQKFCTQNVTTDVDYTIYLGIPHVFSLISHYLDQRDIISMAKMNKHFNNLTNTQDFIHERIYKYLAHINYIINNGLVTQLETAMFGTYATHQTLERFKLLQSSLNDVNEYVTSLLKTRVWVNYTGTKLLIILLESLCKQLFEIYESLLQINHSRLTVTVNFDVFELAIKRELSELFKLFPADGTLFTPIFSLHIDEPDAIDIWQQHVGQTCPVMSFSKFINTIVMTWENGTDPLMHKYLAHLFNFPRDNLMTVYRFRVLNKLFGPYQQISQNFRTIVMTEGCGFVGLMNKVGAEETLTQLLPKLKNNTVLIRFSRCLPEFFAFTSIDISTGALDHRRNINTHNKSIPIKEYISLMFPRHDIALLDMDSDVINITSPITFSKLRSYPYHSHY
jgi:hypothetical protein